MSKSIENYTQYRSQNPSKLYVGYEVLVYVDGGVMTPVPYQPAMKVKGRRAAPRSQAR